MGSGVYVLRPILIARILEQVANIESNDGPYKTRLAPL